MRGTLAIAGREFRSYFYSPLAYVVICLGLLLLGVMFFVVLTPMGLIMRALGKDPLRLRMDRNAGSYWIDRRPPGPAPDTLNNQF